MLEMSKRRCNADGSESTECFCNLRAGWVRVPVGGELQLCQFLATPYLANLAISSVATPGKWRV